MYQQIKGAVQGVNEEKRQSSNINALQTKYNNTLTVQIIIIQTALLKTFSKNTVSCWNHTVNSKL